MYWAPAERGARSRRTTTDARRPRAGFIGDSFFGCVPEGNRAVSRKSTPAAPDNSRRRRGIGSGSRGSRGAARGGLARRARPGARLRGGRAYDDRLHGEVLRQPQLIHQVRRGLVALLDSLPELALVDAGEGRPVLLALVLEDRADLPPQLLLGEGDEDVGVRDRPFLPRAAVIPDVGRRLSLVSLERALHRFVAHAVGSVRIGEIGGDEHDVRPHFLEELLDDLDVTGGDGILPDLAGLVEGKVEESRLIRPEVQRPDRRQGFHLADPALQHQHRVAVHLPRLLAREKLLDLPEQGTQPRAPVIEILRR